MEHELLYRKNKLALALNITLIILLFFIYFVISNFPSYMDSSPYKFINYYSLLVWFLFPIFSLLFFTQNKHNGTLNRLKSLPINTHAIISIKLKVYKPMLKLACFNFIFIIIASSLWYYIDLGLIISGFAEIFLVITLSLSIAMFASMVSSKMIFAPFIAIFISLFFLFADFIAYQTTGELKAFFSYFAFNQRLVSLRRGLLSLNDLYFFIGFIILFIILTYSKLRQKRLKTYVYILLFIPFVLALNSRYPFKIDLTFNHANSLHRVSKQLSKKINSPLYITYYTSPTLNYDLNIKKTFEYILAYQHASRFIYVNRNNKLGEKEAKDLGFSIQNANNSQPLFAGLSIEYKNKVLIIPFLIDYDEVQYQITYKLNELFNSRKKIFLLTGKYRTDDDFTLLKLMLKNHFTLTDNITDANTIIVADDSALSSTESSDIWNMIENSSAKTNEAKSLLITLAPATVNLKNLQEKPIIRTEKPFTTLLYQKGISLSSGFVEDDNGLMVTNKKEGEAIRSESYKNFPNSYGHKNDLLAKITKNIKVLYCGYLDIDNNWDYLLKSFNTSYVRDGFLNFNIENSSSNANTNNTQNKGEFVLMAKHKKLNVITVASDTIFSDLVNSASPANLAYADLLLTYLSGNKELSDIKTKFFTNTVLKNSIHVKSDGIKVLLISVLYFVLNFVFIKFLFNKRPN